MKRPALIVYDAISPESPPDAVDVLVQADAVGEALATLGFHVSRSPVSGTAPEILQIVRSGNWAFVFNLVESLNGEGRYCHVVPLLLEVAQARFTGCGSTALMITSNKPLSKRIMSASGIPTAYWLEDRELDFTNERGPWIVKSVWEHASIGLAPDSVVINTVAARNVVDKRRAQFGGEWFLERYVNGREFNISLLDGETGPEVLAMSEMCFINFGLNEPRIVDYAAKWIPTSPAFERTRPCFERNPADAGLFDELERLALRCWNVFGLSGYARVDVRVDDSGRPFVLEVNANPCLSPDAGFDLAARHRGIDYPTLIARIIESSGSRSTASRAAA